MVATKSRHLIHMTSEGKLEVDMEVLPAEPRRSYGELFSSQLSVLDTIQALQEDTQKGFSHLDSTNEPVKLLPLHLADVFFQTPQLLKITNYLIFNLLTYNFNQ